jgi:hypothetical protein
MTIEEALSSLNIPVKHPPFKEKADTYITYQLILRQSSLDAEGEQETQTNVALDLFTNQPWETLAEQIKTLLKNADYHGVIYGPEMYEDDIGYWHIPFVCWRIGSGTV